MAENVPRYRFTIRCVFTSVIFLLSLFVRCFLALSMLFLLVLLFTIIVLIAQ